MGDFQKTWDSECDEMDDQPQRGLAQNHVVIAQQRDRIHIFTSTTMTEEDASKDIYQ